jgi:hypothetical protein
MKRKNTGTWKSKHWIALGGELGLEEAVDLSLDRLLEDDDANIMLIWY